MATYVIGDIHGRSQLVDQLIRDVPWDIENDKIVFLGDLVDRGDDAPGVVQRLMSLSELNPNLVVLRGNHEQMLLNFMDDQDPQWLIPENGGLATITAYGYDVAPSEGVIQVHIPKDHIDFIRSLRLYHEDDQAIYVHAGLEPGRHPSKTIDQVLLWTRDPDFYLNYHGKLCFFGHTPTQYLPKKGRNRRFGVFINNTCVGIDTSGEEESPLSCIRVDTFTLYQAYPTGVTEVERLSAERPVLESAK